MAPDPRFLRLVTQQASVRRALSQRVSGLTKRLLSGQKWSAWFSDDAVRRSAEQMESYSRAAQQRQASTTSSYMDQLFTAVRPADVQAPKTPAQVVLPESLRNVEDPVEPWLRPAEQFRYATSQGFPPDVALDRAVARAAQLADDDLLLAQREAARQKLITEPKVIGYRRILHPELATTGSCGLCIAASTRRYYVEDLLPIHGGCNCTQAPIYAESDPGDSLNLSDLETLYKLAGDSTAAAKLKKVRVVVQDHSELGPVLREMGQNFQTKADADAQQRKSGKRPPPDAAAAKVIQDRATQTLDELTAKWDAGDKALADPMAFHRELIARMAALHQ